MDDDITPLNDPERFVRLGVWFYGAMAIVAVLWRAGGYGESIWAPTLADATEAVAPWPLLHSIGAGAGIAGLALGVSWLLSEHSGWGRKVATRLAAQLPPISVADALLLAFASGLAEEMFFRGALQPRAGLVVASVLFGVLHMPSERSLWPWTGFALAMGFALGWLFEVSGSLVGPVVAHTLINGVTLPLLTRRYRSLEDEERGD